MKEILKGQTAIVTGGTSGIGKAIAYRFAEQGARVAILGTSQERGKQVVDEIHHHFGPDKAYFYQVNIAHFQLVNNTIEQILKSFGHIDILVNNAGITRDQLLLKMSEEEWDAVIDTNAKSAFNTCKALCRSMIKARKGKIINISSVVGLTGNAGQVNYASSKAALIGFTKALAKELASRDIHVNCVAPGFIETPMTQAMTDVQRQALEEQIPLKRIGKPDDVANMVTFLASDLSNYVTGQVITVDGGMVM